MHEAVDVALSEVLGDPLLERADPRHGGVQRAELLGAILSGG
jgi:hypothetical protein